MTKITAEKPFVRLHHLFCTKPKKITMMARLAAITLLFCLLLGGVVPAAATELLSNSSFTPDLQHWRKAPSLAAWSPLVSGTLDLNPGDDYRGDLIWQPLNIANPGGELFTFQVEMSRVLAEVGSAVSFHVDYMDDLNKLRRSSLLAVSNTQAPVDGEGWLSLQRQWYCPENAVRLIKFVVVRSGPGHLRMKSPSLTHESFTNGTIPTVTGITPTSGPPAGSETTITITGTNFGSSPGHVYVDFVGIDTDWGDTVEYAVQSWTDTSIVLRVTQWETKGGELTVVTSEGLQNSESHSFDLTTSHFTFETLTPAYSVIQGEQATVNFELKTSPTFSTSSGIFLFIPDEDANFVLSQTEVYPAAAATVPITLTIDTTSLSPGVHTYHAQTSEDKSYARWAKFEIAVAARAQSPAASGLTEFQGGESLESGMGLPKYRINLATLDPVLETCLFRMKTAGPPIRLDLWYLGNTGTEGGLFGRDWRLGYESHISHDEYDATLITTSGKALQFSGSSSLHNAGELSPVILNPPAGNHDFLTSYGTYFEYVEKKTKLRYRYEQLEAASDRAYLTRITDRNDQQVDLQTDLATGRITAITDEANRSFSLSYNGDNHCISLQAPDGRSYRFNYLTDRISSIEDPNGYTGTYSYDGTGFMTLLSTAGRQTSFTYDNRPGTADGKYIHLVSTDDGRQTVYAFKSGEPGVVRVTDGRGNVREHHNMGGKPTISIDPTGELRQIGYENERPVTLSDDSGTTRMEYDSRGNLTRLVDALGKETVMVYDASDNLTSRTDALGHTWTYDYDAHNNLKEITDPLSGRMTISRDARGRVSTVTDQENHTRHIAYDNWGNPSTYTDTLNHVSRFIYDNYGMRLKKIEDANGDYKEISYDGLDRVVKVEYRDASSQLLGQRLHQWSAFGATGYTNEMGDTYAAMRNIHGQIISITDPVGAITTSEYDTSGNRVKHTDPLNRITTFEYDEGDRLSRTIDPLGFDIRREYDSEGRLEKLYDQNNNLTFWEYDKRGDLIRERDAQLTYVRTERDALGRPLRRFNGRNQEIQYSYDWLGNMTRKLLHFGLPSQYDYSYSFDGLGNLTSMTGPDGTTGYQYTVRNEPNRIDYPNGNTIQFTYDDVGNIASITYPDGLVVNYQYDRFNRIPMPEILRNARGEFMGFTEPPKKPVSVFWAGGDIDVLYNNAAMPVAIARNNGVDSSLSYDGAGHLLRISHVINSTTINDIDLQYNLAGEITSQAYASADLFPAVTGKTGTYNNLNQVGSWGSQPYTYDLDGNLTAAGDRFTATYDPENRLVSLTRGGSTVTYGYNGLGQRVSRTGSTIRHYLYDRAGKLLCITDGSGSVIADIIYAGTSIISYGTAAGGYRFPLFDSSGNVATLTDGSGAVVAAYRYLPFGQVQRTDSGLENPFTYSGIFGVLDEGDGIYGMRKRFFDSEGGRFLQRDPIGIAGGVNLYAYADNNPLIKNDPNGENPYLIASGLFTGYKIYNAYGTAKHAVNAVDKVRETAGKAKNTADSYGRAKIKSKKLMRLNDETGGSLEAQIEREYQRKDARQDAYNAGVKVKDDAMDTVETAAEAGYHGVRAVMGGYGAAGEQTTLMGKTAEALTDASFNEIDHQVIDWDTVPLPFDDP